MRRLKMGIDRFVVWPIGVRSRLTKFLKYLHGKGRLPQ